MKRARHTFTLVEILTVAAMICLIMSAILVAYNGIYRSWATSNTVAAMKSAHLALDRFKLENGTYPVGSNTLGTISNVSERLKKDLYHDCSPYSYMNGSNLIIFDDFGNKPSKNSQAGVQEIRYVSLAASENHDTFMLMSPGKDGDWETNDEIIYLPHGHHGKNLQAGFYRCSISISGTISGEIETISE